MSILLTGGSGTLGRALRALRPSLLAPSRTEMDVRDADAVRAWMQANRPDAVIHAAAVTNAEACERDHAEATRVNVDGTMNVFREANAAVSGVYVVYVSTAAVFRCDSGGYDEDSVPDPANGYGLTKLQGENVAHLHPNNCIVRTNFVRRGVWPHPTAFSDRYGTFLYDTGAAKGILEVLDARVTGVVHVVGRERLSLYDIARRGDPRVKPISLASWRGPPLPRDMSLGSKRWKSYSLDD